MIETPILAKVGQLWLKICWAKILLAKVGLAKVGQMRMAKVCISRIFTHVRNHNFFPHLIGSDFFPPSQLHTFATALVLRHALNMCQGSWPTSGNPICANPLLWLLCVVVCCCCGPSRRTYLRSIAQHFALYFPSLTPHYRFFFLFLWVSSRCTLVVFEGPCARLEFFGFRVKPRRPQSRRGGHTYWERTWTDVNQENIQSPILRCRRNFIVFNGAIEIWRTNTLFRPVC